MAADLGRSTALLRGPLLSQGEKGRTRFFDDAPHFAPLPGAEEEFCFVHEDFIVYSGPTVADAAPGAGGYVVTEVDTDSDGATAVDVADAAPNGVLEIAGNDNAADAVCLRTNGSPYKYVAGKRMWFYAEVAVIDADDQIVLVGLIPEDANADPAANEPADGLYFLKDETNTKADFRAKKNSTDSGSDEATPAFSDGTKTTNFMSLGIKVLKDGSVEVWAGTSYAAMTVVDEIPAGSAGLPDDEDLQAAFGFQNGAAGVEKIWVDRYVWAFAR